MNWPIPPEDVLLLDSVPIEDYNPDDLGDAAYRAVARVFDENRADRARRKAGGAA